MQRILRRRPAGPQPTEGGQQLAAGQDPQEAAAPGSPGFRERGRLRRRLRYLRRVRELGFRDLGGLIFDLRRFGRERPDLVEAKLDALADVDREMRGLEVALDDVRDLHELREPGISSCPRCGALHASDANFCPRCGIRLRASGAMSEADGGPLAVASATPPDAGIGAPPVDESTEVAAPGEQPTQSLTRGRATDGGS